MKPFLQFQRGSQNLIYKKQRNLRGNVTFLVQFAEKFQILCNKLWKLSTSTLKEQSEVIFFNMLVTFSNCIQAAALALCQYLVAENRKPPGQCQADKEETVEPIQITTPTDTMAARAPRVRRIKPADPPPSPLVAQLIEMGFVRKNVEFAIKALSK